MQKTSYETDDIYTSVLKADERIADPQADIQIKLIDLPTPVFRTV